VARVGSARARIELIFIAARYIFPAVFRGGTRPWADRATARGSRS